MGICFFSRWEFFLIIIVCWCLCNPCAMSQLAHPLTPCRYVLDCLGSQIYTACNSGPGLWYAPTGLLPVLLGSQPLWASIFTMAPLTCGIPRFFRLVFFCPLPHLHLTPPFHFSLFVTMWSHGVFLSASTSKSSLPQALTDHTVQVLHLHQSFVLDWTL